MWGEQDQGGFREGLSEGKGQINDTSVLGKACQKWAKDESYHSYLEVGTWNGLGTTKLIHEMLKKGVIMIKMDMYFIVWNVIVKNQK